MRGPNVMSESLRAIGEGTETWYKEISAPTFPALVAALNSFTDSELKESRTWTVGAVNNESHHWFALLMRNK